jgi:DNA helicase HerA-like ATPase
VTAESSDVPVGVAVGNTGDGLWSAVLFPADEPGIAVGDLVATESAKRRIVSVVLRRRFLTNSASLEAYVASRISRRGVEAVPDLRGEVAVFPVIDARPISIVDASGDEIPVTWGADVAPLSVVHRASATDEEKTFGLRPVDGTGLSLGSLWGTGSPAMVSMAEFFSHVAVVGTTGAGKTRFVAAIIAQLAQREDASIVVIDPLGEYAALLDALGVSALVESRFPGTKRGIGLAPSDFSASLVQCSLPRNLDDSIAAAMMHSFSLLESRYRHQASADQSAADVARRYEAEIEMLAKATSSSAALTAGGQNLRHQFSQPTALELWRLVFRDLGAGRPLTELIAQRKPVVLLDTKALDHRAESIYAVGVIAGLIKARRADRIKRRIIIVLEEAHRFVAPDSPVFAAIVQAVREARKVQLSLVLVSQRMGDFSPVVLGNTGAVAAFRLPDREDIDYLARRSPSFASLLEGVTSLETSAGYFFASRRRVPIGFRTTPY